MATSTHQQPPSLAQLQRWLKHVIAEPRGVGAALADEAGCLPYVTEAPPLSREARLGIYAEAYFLRLADALAQNFPALSRVMGDESFRRLVARYLHAHPSRSYTAEEVGRHLPQFLQGYDLTRVLPFLPDLAALEWAAIQAARADDAPTLDPAGLHDIPVDAWARARLRLAPSVHLLRSDWPIDTIRQAAQDPGAALPARWNERPCWLVVHRQGHAVCLASLDASQFAVLDMMRQGVALAAICDELAHAASGGAELPPVMTWFAAWTGAGIVRDIEFDVAF